jgi:protein OS-9
MTDSIMFVKETKTCHYALVINTPRLCAEPGFKARVDQRDEALIRCRQVVDAATLANADSSLPEADHPFHQRRSSVGVPPPLDAAESPSGVNAETDGDDGSQKAAKSATKDSGGMVDHHDLLRRALEAILQKTAANPTGEGNGADADAGVGSTPRVVVEDVGDGQMVIEFISEIGIEDGEDVGRRTVDDISQLMGSKAFEDALRAVGFDVRDEEVEVEVEGVGVEMGTDAEREREGKEGKKKGGRTLNGAAKGRRRAANAHLERDEL